MKKIITIIFFFATVIFAQEKPHEPGPRGFGEKFEELEKIKLLEVLELDENTAIKFFTRRNQSRKNVDDLMKQGEQIFNKMEDAIETGNKENDYDNLIKQASDIENKIMSERSAYINSLKDILSKEQIIKVILFEHKFKKDVRDLLIEKGRKRFFDDRLKQN